MNNYTEEELLNKKGILSKIILLDKSNTDEKLEENLKSILEKNYDLEEKVKLKEIIYYAFSDKIGLKKAEEAIRMLERKEGGKDMFEEVFEKVELRGYKKGIKEMKEMKTKIVLEMIKNNINENTIISITKISKKEFEEIKKIDKKSTTL